MNCSNSIEHTVEAGDTLYKLSRQYKTTVSSIILSNPRINPYNLQIGMKIEICPGREYTRPEMPGNTGDSGISNNNGKGNLKELMRMAWLNHTYLLRMLLVSMAADLPDQQELVTALIDNAEEIADLFGRYYPENTVNSLRDLLVRQVELTGGLITQKKERRTKDTVEQVRRLNENADRIAELIKALPDPEEIREYLLSVGAKTTLTELGLPDNTEFIQRSLDWPVIMKKIYRHSGISSGRLLPWRIILPAD